VSWSIVLSRQAVKDAKKISNAGLKLHAQELIEKLQKNPYDPPYEKLTGDLKAFYSRRINIKHRLVYQFFDQQKVIKILRMWSIHIC
jgi:toxin YoeB